MNNQSNKQFRGHRLIEYTNGLSLTEISGTMDVPKGKSSFGTLLVYSGPGILIAVDYIDPGNWSTSITGGQNLQYLLISVILISSLIAMLLQYMTAKLGIVTQMDLAQAIRARTSGTLGVILWILTGLAIIATDIAKIISAAIAPYLLSDIPLVIAVFITVLDVFILLLLTKVGFRKIETLAAYLIFVILFVFIYQAGLSNPDQHSLFAGFIPNSHAFSDPPAIDSETPLTGALGIIGAAVMPHNLYSRPAVSQTRRIGHQDEEDVTQTARFSTWDSNIWLSMAFLVNTLLLIMGVAILKAGSIQDPSFFGLYGALSDPSVMSNGILITVAKSGVLSVLFAVALFASDQNSIITGTSTSQVITEGFIHMHTPVQLRRLVIRLLSVIPILIRVLFISTKGATEEHIASNSLMNESQVFLALILPFSMIPLLMMTSSQAETGSRFKNSFIVELPGWFPVISLAYLNLRGLPGQVGSFFGEQTTSAQLALADQIAYVIVVPVPFLLAWTIGDLYKENKKCEQRLQGTIEEVEWRLILLHIY